MERYTIVFRFRLIQDAEFARTVLENHGIQTRLRDEHTALMLSVYENALGGIRLEVPENEVETAQLILQHGGLIPIEPQTKPSFVEKLGDVLGAFPGLSLLPPLVRLMLVLVLLTLFLLLPIALYF